MKNSEIERLSNSTALAAIGNSKEFDAAISFRIARFMTFLLPIVEAYIRIKQELILKYCDKDEGNAPIIKNGMYYFTKFKDEFTEEFAALQAEEMDVPIKLKLPLKSIPKGLLSPNEMKDLQGIIEFEEN